MNLRAFGLSLLVLAAPLAEAREGSLYAKLSYQHKGSGEYAQPDGTLFDIPQFVQDDAFFYLAYGLTDHLVLSASIAAVRSSDLADSPDELQRATGFGDVQIGAAYQLGRLGSWTFGAGGLVQAPTGNEGLSGGLQATGSGVWEGAALLSAGRPLPGSKGSVSFELGPYFRSGGLRDGFLYRAQIGWSLSRRLTLAGNLSGVQRWSNTPGTPDPGSPVGFGDGVTYLALGPSVTFNVDERWGLQGDWNALFHVRNNGTGNTLRVSVFYHR